MTELFTQNRERDAQRALAVGKVAAADLNGADVIRYGRKRAVVTSIQRDQHVTAIAGFILNRDGARTKAEFWTTFAHDQLVTRLSVPSDTSGSTTTNTNQTAATAAEGEATVPTVTRSKSAAKTTKPAGKPAAAKAAPAKPAASKTRRTAEEVAKLVPAFRKHLQGGGTMRQLKAEHGFSDDGPIRTALYNAGFDSKGNEHGEQAGSIDASKAPGKKRVVALRSEGAGWYRLAFLTGLSESEVKAIVSEAGGPTGRVYREPAPKPAKADKPATAKADKPKAAKVTRKATPAPDPSPQA